MSAVCVLTPIVIGSWPMIAAAISGVAASMGFSIAAGAKHEERELRGEQTSHVDLEVPNSEVVSESIESGEQMVITRGDVTVTFGRDHRGACTVCVDGKGKTKAELSAIGQEVAGRVVQQFAYNKLMTELKARNYEVVSEEVAEDNSIRVNVRLNR